MHNASTKRFSLMSLLTTSALVGLGLPAASAQAGTVFSEDFAGATAGTQPNGPIAGTKFVSTGPNVDIVGTTANGSSFFSCIGNPGGACIDLVGNQGAGSTITSTPIALVAGTTYAIAFSDILQGFNVSDPATADFTVSLGTFSANLTSLADVTTARSLSFVAGASDPLAVLSFHTTTAPDGVHGPIVQNISVSSLAAGAVPEPATWTMMIGGFGVIGGAMRVRSRKVRHGMA